MIRPGILIRGKITPTIDLKGKTNASIIREYPELENVEIKPTTEEQILKSEKYGFDEVKILGVTAEIDENIKPENIKVGVSILDVEGGYEGIDTSDATATPNDILIGKTAYADNKKIEGAIEKYDGAYSGDVSKEVQITDASYLFYEGARTESFKEILALCKNITNAQYMFSKSTEIPNFDLSNLDTSNVTNMSHMFSYCPWLLELDLSNFDTSNVTAMSYMFGYSNSIKTLDLSKFDTSNVTSFGGMFYNCLGLTSLILSSFNTSNLTAANYMFYNCLELKDLDLSSFDMSKVIYIGAMFNSCSKLTNLKSFFNLGKGYTQARDNYSNYTLTLSSSTKLTYNSLIDVLINGLYDLNLSYDVANGGTLYRQSCVLGATNLAKVQATEEGQQALAEADRKGWNVS
jgi:surface protein